MVQWFDLVLELVLLKAYLEMVVVVLKFNSNILIISAPKTTPTTGRIRQLQNRAV